MVEKKTDFKDLIWFLKPKTSKVRNSELTVCSIIFGCPITTTYH